MKTYSERIAPLRAFLKAHNATAREWVVHPEGQEIERWQVNGRPLIVLIEASGAWQACAPMTGDASESPRTDLERYLLGPRPDLDLITGMDRICSAFLDKLSEFPTCSDLDCGQKICEDNRALRHNVKAFQDRLKPAKEKQNVPA